MKHSVRTGGLLAGLLLGGAALVALPALPAPPGALQASGRAPVDPLLTLQTQSELPETAAGARVFLAATGCGVERWAIKTGTDAEAKAISLTAPTAVTIAALRAKAKPSSYPSSRIGPVEKTLYQLDATLTKYKAESDGDLHLVLQDAAGRTLIVEIPDPACMGSSPWKASVTAARKTFTARYAPTSSFKTTSKHILVRGVGFFDKLHGQTGVAPNGIELHAVTGLAF